MKFVLIKKSIMFDILFSLIFISIFWGLPIALFEGTSRVVTKVNVNKKNKHSKELYLKITELYELNNYPDDLIFAKIIEDYPLSTELHFRLINKNFLSAYDSNIELTKKEDLYSDSLNSDGVYIYDEAEISQCFEENTFDAYYWESPTVSGKILFYYLYPIEKDSNTSFVLMISFPIMALSLTNYSEYLIIITVVLIMLSIGLGIYLNNKIAYPLNMLAKETIEVADENGKFKKTILYGNDRNDEIGSLSKSFTKVIEKVNYRINEIENLSSDLSHELKNPLSVIYSIAEIIETGDFTEEERKQFSKTIMLETKKINSIISKIRESSKIENKVYEANNEYICIDDFLQHIIMDFSETYPNISFITELRLCKSTVFINRELLSIAIENILNNAISFANKIKISSSWGIDTIIIQIEDNGPGIQDCEKDKVFNRFYSKRIDLDNSFHDGLGLYLVKYIMNSAHGNISIKDGKDLGGAAFILEFPLFSEIT